MLYNDVYANFMQITIICVNFENCIWLMDILV